MLFLSRPAQRFRLLALTVAVRLTATTSTAIWAIWACTDWLTTISTAIWLPPNENSLSRSTANKSGSGSASFFLGLEKE